MANIGPPVAILEAGEAEAAARTLGIESTRLEIRRAEDIPTAFDSLKGRAEALHLASDHLLNTNRLQVNTLALAARLPTMHTFRALVETGGLMFYGPNFEHLFRRAGHMLAHNVLADVQALRVVARSLQGGRAPSPQRPVAPARALCQSAAAAASEPDCPAQGREAALGCTQDPRAPGPAARRRCRVPAKSTIHAVLDRHGLVKRGGGPRHRARGTPLSEGAAPNDLWCADFKGEFKLGDGHYCYPLTVTDHASRFLLLCEALESTREDLTCTAFEQLFHERGLPLAIRSDNGVPFASPNALFNLSKLSVWWLRLGIAIERIKPGHPQQNGRHERMHLTLKKEATRPPGLNCLQQQDRFDAFVHEFNVERPHEALGMKCPAELYVASSRPMMACPS